MLYSCRTGMAVSRYNDYSRTMFWSVSDYFPSWQFGFIEGLFDHFMRGHLMLLFIKFQVKTRERVVLCLLTFSIIPGILYWFFFFFTRNKMDYLTTLRTISAILFIVHEQALMRVAWFAKFFQMFLLTLNSMWQIRLS